VGEGFERERAPRLVADLAALAQLGEDAVVLFGARHHRHPGVVLRRGARHRGTADVDRLDVGRLEERVQVGHDHVEHVDAVRLHVGEVRLLAAVGEDPAVNLRVQRHDAVVEHLGKACDLGKVPHRHAGLLDRARRAARRHELPTELVQRARELDDA
jgi:hypothetical protein